MTQCYEDLSTGDTFPFREYRVTEEAIREFAKQFDPQPFHLDEEAATDSVFDDLVASGWHTASISMRLLVDDVFGDIAIMGGRGIDDLRWFEPVYPGDVLTGETEIVGKSLDRTGQTHGDVKFEVRVENQDGTPVMSYTTLSMVRRST